ncbi:hypothetical protein ACWGS9_32370 [Bradyrhizobium sp. Arg314]
MTPDMIVRYDLVQTSVEMFLAARQEAEALGAGEPYPARTPHGYLY